MRTPGSGHLTAVPVTVIPGTRLSTALMGSGPLTAVPVTVIPGTRLSTALMARVTVTVRGEA